MHEWGRNRNIIYIKEKLTVDEAREVLDRFKDGKVCITLSAIGEEPGTWDKMVEVNQVTSYELGGSGKKYNLNFKDKQYLCNGEPIHLTESEARILYFMLTSKIVLDGYADAVSNMKRRYKHSTVLEELFHDEITIVGKK